MSNSIRNCLIIILTFVWLALNPAHSKENKKETYEQLDLFGQVFDLIKSKYVEEVESKELIEAAINGMLSSLDPHSGFLAPKSYDDMQVDTKGSFGGLGIEVNFKGIDLSGLLLGNFFFTGDELLSFAWVSINSSSRISLQRSIHSSQI